MCCCNFDDGGRNGGKAPGELNGMYGKTHTDSVKKLLHDINSDGRHSGDKNSQYGVSPKDRMDAATYDIWRKKQRSRKDGELNPNYGNHRLHKKYSENHDLACEKQSRPGIKNGRATKISMYDSSMNFEQSFPYIFDCVDYLITNKIVKSKNRNAVYQGIYNSNKNKRKYYGYYFCY